MTPDTCRQAAITLASRRLSGSRGPLLAAELAPATLDDALAIQQAVSELLGNAIGGWKCGLPDAERKVVAPIYASTVSVPKSPNCRLAGTPGCSSSTPA